MGFLNDLLTGLIRPKKYKELLNKKDIDLVVNASFSDMHFAITKDLLEHGFNVLCPNRRSRPRIRSC